ncbi:hypothetical protein [Actinomadura rudentiformis]|nr:hypothetical protein [Actinomadura rudentiformis]
MPIPLAETRRQRVNATIVLLGLTLGISQLVRTPSVDDLVVQA